MTSQDQPLPKPPFAANEAPVRSDAAEAATGPKWRTFWLTAAALLLGIACVSLFLEYFVAHRMPPLTEATLDAAEKLWAEKKPASYVLDLQILGAEPGPVHVEVVNGEVVAMQRNGITPDQRRVWDVWTVPGQFETLERELELAANPAQQMDAPAGTRLSLQCEFEAHYGFPLMYHRIVYGGGPEVFWRTIKFEAK